MIETILIALLKFLLDRFLPTQADLVNAITGYAEGKKTDEKLLNKVNEALAIINKEIEEPEGAPLPQEEKEKLREEAFDKFFDTLRP